MSPSCFVRLPLSNGFPRVSGDEPGHEGNADAVKGFSPRERG